MIDYNDLTKSWFTSRTNGVAAVMLIFGLLLFFGWLPEWLTGLFGLLVAGGSTLIIYFRSTATKLLE